MIDYLVSEESQESMKSVWVGRKTQWSLMMIAMAPEEMNQQH
jgi:hypothetical protein